MLNKDVTGIILMTNNYFPFFTILFSVQILSGKDFYFTEVRIHLLLYFNGYICLLLVHLFLLLRFVFVILTLK